MKIRSIRIGSFGFFKDKNIENLNPGLTVFYGKNESGKSTLMEFIRTTLFQSSKRRNYPLSSPMDSGEITIEKDDKSMFTLIREKRKVRINDGACAPLSMTKLDYDTYSKIFAMSAEDLRNIDIISSTTIRSKFLTIPGGERLPDLIDSLEKEKIEIGGNERRGESYDIGKIISKIKGLDGEISNSSATNDLYSELSSNLDIKTKELEKLKKENIEFDGMRNIKNVELSQMGNLERLSTLNGEIKTLEESKIIAEDDQQTYNKFKYKIEEKNKTFENIKTRYFSQVKVLNNLNPETIIEHKENIRTAYNSRDTYLSLREDKTSISKKIEQGSKYETPVKSSKSKLIIVPILLAICGIIFTLMGLTINEFLFLVGIVSFIAAGVMFLCVNKKRKNFNNRTPTSSKKNLDSGIEDLKTIERRIEIITSNLDNVMKNLNLNKTTFIEDSNILKNMLDACLRCIEIEKEKDSAELDKNKAVSEYNVFISRFSSEERFIKLIEMNKNRITKENQKKELEGSINSSGYNPSREIPNEIPNHSDKIEDLNRERGYISAEMKNIIDEGNLEELMTAKSSLDTELNCCFKKWGTVSLASKIIELACDRLYESVQPDVIKTADRYICLMTDGKYHLGNNLKNRDITIINKDQEKSEILWSTGLGDQVKLSLKMAVARELTEEKLPLILDDILLTFDTDRKIGACKALKDLSKDMQILLFTCDAETRDIMIKEEVESISI